MQLEKIHILSGDVFKEKFPNFQGVAFYRATEDVVYVNKDRTDTKARLFAGLLHELIHRASTVKFYANHEGGISEARVGYRVRSPWKGPTREDRLIGFNELMTDFVNYKILLKNQKLLETTLGITKQEIKGPIYTYMHYEPIIESIIKKIAEDEGIPIPKAFENLERGEFQNNILVLKKIERSFGEGALKIISLLQVLEKDEDNKKLEEMVKSFFTEGDSSKRQTIRLSIYDFVRNFGI